MNDKPVRPKDKFLVFGAPVVEEDGIRGVVDSMKGGWLGTGPKVARFERDFAAYKGVPEGNVAAVNSCTAALHLSMLAAGLEPGDEFITTPLTLGLRPSQRERPALPRAAFSCSVFPTCPMQARQRI